MFYLKDIDSFLDVIDKNKDRIIKTKNFESIEVIPIEEIKNLNIDKILKNIDDILKFSNAKKILLINFKSEFWESMAKISSEINRKNIELCFNTRKMLVEYRKTVNNLIKDEKNKIRENITKFYKKGKFISQLDKMIKKYIETNQNITNIEIIELIKSYDRDYIDE